MAPPRAVLSLVLLVAFALAACSQADDRATTEDGTDAATGEAAAPPPTVDELLARDEPLVLAHAGGDQDHPHSTLYGYAESVAAGTDVLELDVQLTSDGVLVVQHDDTVDRTTETTGEVADLTLEQLQALDDAYWFSEQCWRCDDLPEDAYTFRGVRTGEQEPPDGYEPDDFAVPTLQEVAERFPEMPLDVEIKGDGEAGRANAAALAAELEELGRVDSTVVASFDEEVLAAFQEAAPEVATSPSLSEMTDWVLGGVPLEGYQIMQIPPEYEGIEVVTPDLIERAAEAGIAVWVWPNDSEQENEGFYQQLFELGADGIIAGRPAEAVAARSASAR